MRNPFEVGGRYRNRKGEYEVVSIDGDTMVIRWTDGLTWEGKVALQARIWERTQRQERVEEQRASRPRRRATAARRRRPTTRGAEQARVTHGRMPPASQERIEAVAKALLDYGATIGPSAPFQAVVPQARELIVSDPYAFAIATCLHRGMKADVIWTIPYDIKGDLGHLDPFRVHRMSLDEMADLFARLPRRPRCINDAPRTLNELTTIVVEDCDGDASRMWKDKTAAEVRRTFVSIHGVGPGIANMAVLLLERGSLMRFDDEDHRTMDIKPDVHTRRVLYRLGVSHARTADGALEAARRLNPRYPGEVDEPLLWIGRGWCFATDPNCGGCPVEHVCAKRIS